MATRLPCGQHDPKPTRTRTPSPRQIRTHPRGTTFVIERGLRTVERTGPEGRANVTSPTHSTAQADTTISDGRIGSITLGPYRENTRPTGMATSAAAPDRAVTAPCRRRARAISTSSPSMRLIDVANATATATATPTKTSTKTDISTIPMPNMPTSKDSMTYNIKSLTR